MVATPLKKLSHRFLSDITIPPILWSSLPSFCYPFVPIHWHTPSLVPKVNCVALRLKVCFLEAWCRAHRMRCGRGFGSVWEVQKYCEKKEWWRGNTPKASCMGEVGMIDKNNVLVELTDEVRQCSSGSQLTGDLRGAGFKVILMPAELRGLGAAGKHPN